MLGLNAILVQKNSFLYCLLLEGKITQCYGVTMKLGQEPMAIINRPLEDTLCQVNQHP